MPQGHSQKRGDVMLAFSCWPVRLGISLSGKVSILPTKNYDGSRLCFASLASHCRPSSVASYCLASGFSRARPAAMSLPMLRSGEGALLRSTQPAFSTHGAGHWTTWASSATASGPIYLRCSPRARVLFVNVVGVIGGGGKMANFRRSKRRLASVGGLFVVCTASARFISGFASVSFAFRRRVFAFLQPLVHAVRARFFRPSFPLVRFPAIRAFHALVFVIFGVWHRFPACFRFHRASIS